MNEQTVSEKIADLEDEIRRIENCLSRDDKSPSYPVDKRAEMEKTAVEMRKMVENLRYELPGEDLSVQTTVNTALPSWKQRLLQERKELYERTMKLGTFLGTPDVASLSLDQRFDLNSQFQVMHDYLEILDRRIARDV